MIVPALFYYGFHNGFKAVTFMIFYFSCTGNTRWAARKMADALGDRLIDIAEVMRNAPDDDSRFCYHLKDDERMGIFYPVHGWRPPVLVRNFIRRLDVLGTGCLYSYAVCTAGDNIGEAEKILEEDLIEVGLRIDSAISLIMPESYVGLPFMDVDKPEKERLKKEIAEKRLMAFIDDVKNCNEGVRDLVIGRWPRINSRLIGSAFLHLLKDNAFRVDADKCIGCGKCASLCPVADIEIGEDKMPHWLHNDKCLTCFSCYHHCPVRAIEFGNRTKGKGQYYYERWKNVKMEKCKN